MKTGTKTKTKILSYFISAVLILSAFVPVVLSPVASSAVTRNISFNTEYQDNLPYSDSVNTYNFELSSAGSFMMEFETSTATRTSAWKVTLTGTSDSKVYDVKYFGGASASASATKPCSRSPWASPRPAVACRSPSRPTWTPSSASSRTSPTPIRSSIPTATPGSSATA